METVTNMLVFLDGRIWETKLQKCISVFVSYKKHFYKNFPPVLFMEL